MSRSFRHTPITGNTLAESEKKDKRFANRSWRRVVKTLVHAGVFEVLPAQREVSNHRNFDKDGEKRISDRYPGLMDRYLELMRK